MINAPGNKQKTLAVERNFGTCLSRRGGAGAERLSAAERLPSVEDLAALGVDVAAAVVDVLHDGPGLALGCRGVLVRRLWCRRLGRGGAGALVVEGVAHPRAHDAGGEDEPGVFRAREACHVPMVGRDSGTLEF